MALLGLPNTSHPLPKSVHKASNALAARGNANAQIYAGWHDPNMANRVNTSNTQECPCYRELRPLPKPTESPLAESPRRREATKETSQPRNISRIGKAWSLPKAEANENGCVNRMCLV